MNIQILSEAIKEHIGSSQVIYLNENSFRLNNQTLNFNGSLVTSDLFAFRFKNIKNFLQSLRDTAFFPVSDVTINHICNRYRHLINQKKLTNGTAIHMGTDR